MSTTYTKLRSGDWGLRGAGLREGETVTVTKRSGATKVETVGRVIWSGQDRRTGQHVSLATIASQRTSRSSSRQCRDCGCTDPHCVRSGRCSGPAFDPCHDCR